MSNSATFPLTRWLRRSAYQVLIEKSTAFGLREGVYNYKSRPKLQKLFKKYQVSDLLISDFLQITRKPGALHIDAPLTMTSRHIYVVSMIELCRSLFLYDCYRDAEESAEFFGVQERKFTSQAAEDAYFSPYASEVNILAYNLMCPVELFTAYCYENVDDRGMIDFGFTSADFNVPPRYCADWAIMNSLLDLEVYGSFVDRKRGLDGSGRAKLRSR